MAFSREATSAITNKATDSSGLVILIVVRPKVVATLQPWAQISERLRRSDQRDDTEQENYCSFHGFALKSAVALGSESVPPAVAGGSSVSMRYCYGF